MLLSTDEVSEEQIQRRDDDYRYTISFDNGPTSCACVLLEDFEPIQDKLFDFELPHDWTTKQDSGNEEERRQASEESVDGVDSVEALSPMLQPDTAREGVPTEQEQPPRKPSATTDEVHTSA